jgi:hypothetical protein
MYRRADNWQSHARRVFPNPKGLAETDVEWRLMAACDDEEVGTFMAGQVGMPETFSWYDGGPDEYDHCWHELNFVEETDEVQDDDRPIELLITQFEKAKANGWEDFDPQDVWEDN